MQAQRGSQSDFAHGMTIFIPYARQERTIRKPEKNIRRCDRIVVDELGYIPLDRTSWTLASPDSPSQKLRHPNPRSRRTADGWPSQVLNHKEDAVADSLEPVCFLRLADQWPT